MEIDRLRNWQKFSGHMEVYIKKSTVEKYGFGDPDAGGFDLMSLGKPFVCVWNILRYAVRLWNGKGKAHDLEKIAHYAEIAWTMNGGDEKGTDQNQEGRTFP